LETHPLELLPPLLLAEGVGGVHDLPTLGGLHLFPLPLALRRRNERAAAAAVDLAERREGGDVAANVVGMGLGSM
jgi:hypothetical protein